MSLSSPNSRSGVTEPMDIEDEVFPFEDDNDSSLTSAPTRFPLTSMSTSTLTSI